MIVAHEHRTVARRRRFVNPCTGYLHRLTRNVNLVSTTFTSVRANMSTNPSPRVQRVNLSHFSRHLFLHIVTVPYLLNHCKYRLSGDKRNSLTTPILSSEPPCLLFPWSRFPNVSLGAFQSDDRNNFKRVVHVRRNPLHTVPPMVPKTKNERSVRVTTPNVQNRRVRRLQNSRHRTTP